MIHIDLDLLVWSFWCLCISCHDDFTTVTCCCVHHIKPWHEEHKHQWLCSTKNSSSWISPLPTWHQSCNVVVDLSMNNVKYHISFQGSCGQSQELELRVGMGSLVMVSYADLGSAPCPHNSNSCDSLLLPGLIHTAQRPIKSFGSPKQRGCHKSTYFGRSKQCGLTTKRVVW